MMHCKSKRSTRDRVLNVGGAFHETWERVPGKLIVIHIHIGMFAIEVSEEWF